MKFTSLLLSIAFVLSSHAQTGTDIILYDVKINSKGISLSNPVNITNHPGYDNQPFFYKSFIYYSSATDTSQMDIRKYDIKTGSTTTFTNTIENEFSPTVTSDRKFISCILQRKNGKQDLVKYPIKGGNEIIIIDDLKVGYHTWMDNNNLLLFVLEDSNKNALYHYNVAAKSSTRITEGIGRSLHKIPGSNAFSFIKKTNDNWTINKVDRNFLKPGVIKSTLQKREDITWTTKGWIISSDGTDMFYSMPGKTGWEKIVVSSTIILKNITRLAINKANTKLAVVISE